MAAYPVTVALSAFLLFLIQPMVAKQLLPWFGGSASVWTTCMLFFQLLLVAGYAYSDLLVRRLALGRQVLVHGALVAASLVTLPVVAPAGLKPQPQEASSPTSRILLLLLVTVGLPYFVLSTTGPLVQAWFARTTPGARVYRLYAVSNVASLAALVSYPVAVEPHATGRWQSFGWSVAYALFAASLGVTAWLTCGRARSGGGALARLAVGPELAHAEADRGPRPAVRDMAMWFVLATVGSTLLLAVTAQLTQNIASVPFLWVLPLAIYLLTFAVAFDGTARYWRRTYLILSAALVVAMMAAAIPWEAKPLLALAYAVPLYALGLFVTCMFCHGELAARTPDPRFLTRFYLAISLGGAAGGVFVGVLAPLVFTSYLELPIALCAAAALLYVTTAGRFRFVGAAALLSTCALAALYERGLHALAVASSRSFYGALRVDSVGPDGDRHARLRLTHGVTLHGEQFRSPELRRAPTAYYGESSGFGRALQALGAGPLRVGVIGMGVGTVATYGRAGDLYRFYELDEDVVQHARASFSYIADSAAAVEIVMGDARLSLESEPPQGYDLLVVDAFSSDSIPVHLLTVEAMRLYARHVSRGGIIAFHVSNQYLELAPVVRLAADEVGGEALRVLDEPPREAAHLLRSEWVLVARDLALADRVRAGDAATEVTLRDGLRPWTDDYGNLLQALRRSRSRSFVRPPIRPDGYGAVRAPLE